MAEAPDRAASIIEEERETARRAADELRYLVRRLHAIVSATLYHHLRTLRRWFQDICPMACHSMCR